MKGFAGWPPSWTTLLLLPALFLGFTVHELAHSVVAYALGDTSQVERRRLSFNPLRHVSWIGMLAFILIGFGWARQVWVDYSRLRIKNRPLGMFLIAVAGPASNLFFALLALLGMLGTVLTVQTLGTASLADTLAFLSAEDPGLTLQGLAIALSSTVFGVNIILALFNLLPIPPLDGFTAMVSLLTVVRVALRREQRPAMPPPAWRPSTRGAAGAPVQASPAQIHFQIGLEYHRQGLYDEAVVRYRQAIDQDPGFALAYYNLGLAYVAKGRLALAAGAFRSTLQYSASAGVTGQAELRLRELSRVGQGGSDAFGPLPAPLELDMQVEAPSSSGPPPLDPTVARHVWVRLGVGGAAFAILSVLVWLFVTGVTLVQLG
jgi:Zn-dependent protease